MAAQDQALRTNAIKTKIDKTANDSKCRLYKREGGNRRPSSQRLQQNCTDRQQEKTQQSSLYATLESVQEIPSTCSRKMVGT